MAADTDLLYKTIPGHPAKIRVGYFLNAIIEHSSETKAIITAPSQHQYPVAAAQRVEKKRNILGVCLDEVFLFFSFSCLFERAVGFFG
ncbi:hypothetical protein A4A49_37804 [Nicotiana attenuata]|uniref:Uncharacterized protein n=1 Tax=Nicotiana attenuata TaxID=49451 RepID=A0A1J6HWI3_NICAT|nr:hypothetical protein A4A49_37804 [Nicotiana attenuata]